MNNNIPNDVIYFTSQVLNNSVTDSSTVNCIISQSNNPVVDHMSDYSLYCSALTVSTAEVPYMNILRLINWNPANFVVNKTNLSISVVASNPLAKPFTIPAPTALYNGIGAPTGNTYNGVVVFLQYVSENSTQLNPADVGFVSSAGYPRGYFNIHSINQFVEMINTAINTAFSLLTVPVVAPATPYFSYDPIDQLYSYTYTDAVKALGLDLYANSFLERYYDGFRWRFYKNSNVTDVGYDGLDYKLITTTYLFNTEGGITTVPSETSTIQNLTDIHSVIIVSGGSLADVRKEFLPLKVGTNDNFNMPSLAVLKNLEVNFTSLSFSTLNNCLLQFSSMGMFFPIQTQSSKPLTNIVLQLYIMTIDNELYPVQLPAGGGYCQIKFALSKK